jgi:regulator of sigma E protease
MSISIFYNILSVSVLLGVLIFVHELGHFLVAKYTGVSVLKFSLGFGPKLIGRKKGETEYLLSAVPLGGYVKLYGESDEEEIPEEERKRSFLYQPIMKRIAIVVAGPLFNFLFAVFTFALIFMIGLPTLTTEIGSIQPASPAAQAGLKEGDKIVAIGEDSMSRWPDLAGAVIRGKGTELSVTVDRSGERLEFLIKPELVHGNDIFGEETDTYKIGVGPSTKTFIDRQNPVRALWSGIIQTYTITELTVVGLYKMVEGVVSPKTLGGPILIAQMAGAHVKKGIIYFISFMALLSVNLAVLNLLPIPVLDGGHLLFYFIELITGKAISIKWREMAQQVGFVLLIMLMVFVFYNDIVRIISE